MGFGFRVKRVNFPWQKSGKDIKETNHTALQFAANWVADRVLP